MFLFEHLYIYIYIGFIRWRFSNFDRFNYTHDVSSSGIFNLAHNSNTLPESVMKIYLHFTY